MTTRIRGAADHLQDRVHALFVAPRDSRALAEALRQLRADDRLRQRMAVANRIKVAEFAPSLVAPRYLELIQTALGETQSSDVQKRGERGLRRHLLSDCTVAASRLARGTYDAPPPFHPGSAYPVPIWSGWRDKRRLRRRSPALQLLRFDEERCESPEWNPLGVIVRPGDKVVVKPNLLWHSHKHRPAEWQQVVTHGSVVRAVVDYVLIALRGTGEVWIVDGPQSDADWEKLIARTGLDSVTRFYEQVSSSPVRLLDLREVWLDVRGDAVRAQVTGG